MEPAFEGGASGEAAVPARRSALSAFAHHDFRYLLVGTMGSNMGDWIQTAGQGWLVYLLTGSATQLGIFAFVKGMVILAITPFGGTVVDRLDRRKVLSISTTAGGLTAIALAVLVATGEVRVWHLYVTAILDGLVAAISQPAWQVMVYDVVGADDLTNAIALNSMGGNLTRLVGPSLGGLLIGTLGVSWCFFSQAAAYILAGAATFLIRNSHLQGAAARPRPVEHASVLESIAEGFRYSLHHRTVLLLLLVGMIPSLLVYPYLRFVQVFAINIFHIGGLGYGILFTGVGVGSLVGAAWIARHSAFERQGLKMLWGNVVYMLGIAMFAIVRQVEIAFAFLIIAGVANTLYNTLNQTLLQFNIEDEYRGRVLALYLTLNSVTPIGALAMGAMIDHWDAPSIVFGWCLAATLVMLLILLRSPRLRSL